MERKLAAILGMCSALAIAQTALQPVRETAWKGDARASTTTTRTAALDTARSLEALGENRYRISDIGEAKDYWDEALLLRQRAFGDSSLEAAVGYAHQARYHNYMAASQLDHQRSAYVEGARARHLLKTRKGHIDALERVLVLREFGYAFKVFEQFDPTEHHAHLVATRSFYREALRAAIAAQDTIWIAQVTHDIGNTFTDEAGWSDLPVPKTIIVDSALGCYERSIALMTAAGFGTSEAVMMDHYTTGLLYKGAYGADSSRASIAAFDRALRTMLQNAGQPPDVDPLTYDARITNPAQMVELFFLRAHVLGLWDDTHPDNAHVDEAIRTLEAAVPYWKQLLREYRSHDIEKVVGSYGHYPFQPGSVMYMRRYRRKGDPEDLLRSLIWSERNRGASLQRKRMLAGLPTDMANDSSLTNSALIASKGSVVIAYNHPAFKGAFVVDENGLSVTELGEIPADLDRSTGRFDAFDAGKQGWTPERYAQESYAWYARLLKPVLERRQVREIVIVPYGSLALLPFEALCTSPDAVHWRDAAFLGKQYRVRYARSVAEALMPQTTCPIDDAFLATVHADSLADMPFARTLAEELHAELRESVLEEDLTGTELVDALTRPGSIHIATHGVNPATPDAAPFLLLSDGAWAATALQDELSRRTLAVLSTCSSGSGRNYQGEGVMSIAHAFLGAGTKAVVHTLWPVDDRATSEILRDFYNGLQEGLPASEALARAKQEFIMRHAADGLADPFYWSGIVLTGNDVRMERSHNNAWWYSLSVLPILAGGYMFSRRRRRSRALAET
ncbi:MAG: CHAT domain-containing protein [Flavobacteriales bacterium]|nr:CHAT domain-containing protein [Flavobacteriales bacterium]